MILLTISLLSILASFLLGYHIGYGVGEKSYIKERTKRTKAALEIVNNAK